MKSSDLNICSLKTHALAAALCIRQRHQFARAQVRLVSQNAIPPQTRNDPVLLVLPARHLVLCRDHTADQIEVGAVPDLLVPRGEQSCLASMPDKGTDELQKKQSLRDPEDTSETPCWPQTIHFRATQTLEAPREVCVSQLQTRSHLRTNNGLQMVAVKQRLGGRGGPGRSVAVSLLDADRRQSRQLLLGPDVDDAIYVCRRLTHHRDTSEEFWVRLSGFPPAKEQTAGRGLRLPHHQSAVVFEGLIRDELASRVYVVQSSMRSMNN